MSSELLAIDLSIDLSFFQEPESKSPENNTENNVENNTEIPAEQTSVQKASSRWAHIAQEEEAKRKRKKEKRVAQQIAPEKSIPPSDIIAGAEASMEMNPVRLIFIISNRIIFYLINLFNSH